MRSVMMSITIIMFCLSVGVVNEVSDQFFTDTNRTLYGGFQSTPFLDKSNLGMVEDVGSFNESLGAMTTPTENPVGVLDFVWAGFTFVWQLVLFFVNVLINSTINFGSYIQNLGHDGLKVIPDYIADILTIGVCINHLIAIGQILGKVNLKEGL